MKRFLMISAFLAVTFVAIEVKILPVRCEVCREPAFNTSIASILAGGHGDVIHERCTSGFANSPFLAVGLPHLRIEQIIPSQTARAETLVPIAAASVGEEEGIRREKS